MQAFLDKYKLINVFVVLLIIYLFLTRILLIFSYSVDLDGLEFIFIYYIQHLLEHNQIYNNPTEFPFRACLFVPAYLYFSAFIVKLFNVDYKNLHSLYITVRIISLSLFISQLILFISYIRYRFKIQSNILLPVILFYLLLITGHMYVVRPDAMKFLLFTTGFICLFEYHFYNSNKLYLILFLILSVLNVYTKQDSFIYISLLIVGLFIVTKKIKYLFLLILFYLLTAIVFGICVLFFGPFFYTNVIMFNFQKVDHVFNSINSMFSLFSLIRIIPVVIFAFILTKYNYNHTNKNSERSFLILAFSIIGITAHLFILRAGSYINYAFESIFILVFLLFYLLQNFTPDNLLSGKIKYLILFYFICLFMTNIIIHSYTFNFNAEKKIKLEYYENIKNGLKINSIVKNEVVYFPNIKNGLFCSDRNIIFGYDYNIGRLISFYLPLKVNSQLMFFDSKNYDECFVNGKVRYIINDSKNDSDIKKYYPHFKICNKVGDLNIYCFQ